MTLHHGDDGLARCGWVAGIDAFTPYHDSEWGWPVTDDRRLFEKLCLESFQAGLSWRTILAKRPAFRTAFAEFDWERVAQFGTAEVEELLHNPGIVRHRGKIEATINNAQRACELVESEGSIGAFVWSFEPRRFTPDRGSTTIPESIALSKELRRRGWKFLGPTTVFAFQQAMGLVNDHASGCWVREPALDARATAAIPRRAVSPPPDSP